MQKHRKSLPNGRQQGDAFGAAPFGVLMAVHIAISFQKVQVIENIVKFVGNPKERFISIGKVYRISSSLRVKVIAENKVIGPIEPIGPKVARKWPRDINTEMVMKVVAMRAVNFSIGRFCTEFRRKQLSDDIFGMVSKWNRLSLRVKVIGLFKLKRLKPITEQVYRARKVKRLTG